MSVYISETKFAGKPIWMMTDFIDKNSSVPKDGLNVSDWMSKYALCTHDDVHRINGFLIDLGGISGSRGMPDRLDLPTLLRMGEFAKS